MLLILIILCNSVLSFAEEIVCNKKTIDKLDEYTMRLTLVGDPDKTFPKNDKEALDLCQENARMLNWGKNYSKTCLVSRDVETSRHVINLLTYTGHKLLKKKCRTEKLRKIFIGAGKCGNLAKNETIKCFNQYSYGTEQINRSKKTRITNEKHLIPLICCTYHKFSECCSNAYTNPAYAQVCTPKVAEELDSYIQETMNDVVYYLCGDYQTNNDKCDRLLQRYSNVFQSVKLDSVPKSSLSASLAVFDSIPPVQY